MGIQNHSSKHAGDSYIIFATDQNIDPRPLFDCKPCKGAYKHVSGQTVVESSYIINAKHFPALKASGHIDNQESILILGPWYGAVSGHRPATLHFLDNETLPINLGYLTKVPEWIARAEDNWTEKDGDYYVCRHYLASIPK
jgi:hypothetical protein